MYDSFSLTKLVLNLGYLLPFVIKSIHSKSFGGFLFNSYKSFILYTPHPLPQISRSAQSLPPCAMHL